MGAMRVQLSLELLVYIAMAAASLVASLSLFLPYYSGLQAKAYAAWFQGFVASVNYAIGYSASAFAVQVPQGLCNSTVSGGRIKSAYGTFQLYGNVVFSPGLCNDTGKTVILHVARIPGGYTVG